MILRDRGDTLRVVTQSDHAHWAYLLLSAWPSLGEHPRRAAILRATRRHDRGWQGIDASPVVDETGRPHDFRSLPTSLREDVWKQTVERRHWPQEPPNTVDGAMDLWAEMLIAQHAWRIHRGPSTLPGSTGRSQDLLPLATLLTAERRERLEWIQDHQDGLRPLLALDEDPELAAENDDSWVRTLDYLSLMVCHGWEESREFMIASEPSGGRGRGFRFDAEVSSGRLVLHPNPLRGTVRIPLRCREVENRRFSGDRDWALTLARAPWLSEFVPVGPRASA